MALNNLRSDERLSSQNLRLACVVFLLLPLSIIFGSRLGLHFSISTVCSDIEIGSARSAGLNVINMMREMLLHG